MLLLQRKAIYNLIQINLMRGELERESLPPWQTENYRECTNDELFERLDDLGIEIQPESYEAYALEIDAPEEMAETLTEDREQNEQDQAYLILFELWRRFFPERRTVSIFCDELDYQMTQHDLGHESDLEDTLAYLQQILDNHVDQGVSPHKAMEQMQTYCANDIESFLFDYILEVVEERNYDYAAELLEGFFRYIKETIWFEYLAARTEIINDPKEGYELLEMVTKKVKEDTALELIEEMLYFLASSFNPQLFHTLAEKAFSRLQTEGDFHEMLEICYLFCEGCEKQEGKQAISEIFYRRKETPSETPLAPNDPDLTALHALL